jgi:hypothetical protein
MLRQFSNDMENIKKGDTDLHGSARIQSVKIRENLCPISFYANLVKKIYVGIELLVACVTIAGNAEEGNQFILLLSG